MNGRNNKTIEWPMTRLGHIYTANIVQIVYRLNATTKKQSSPDNAIAITYTDQFSITFVSLSVAYIVHMVNCTSTIANILQLDKYTLCSWTKETKTFFVISPIKLRDSDEIWYTVSVFWINLLQNDENVSRLTWIMSLHYLVKLTKCSLRTCYTVWVVTEGNFRIYHHLNCGL